MTQDKTTVSFPLVDALQQSLNKTLFGSSSSAVDSLLASHGEAYLEDFERYLGLLTRAFPEKPFPQWPARGFQRLGSTILREEIAFKQTGRYSAGPEELESLKEDFYANPEVMEEYYLVGLLCSYFLWPHHYRLLEFYRRSFLDAAPGDGGLVMEWGPGHGLLGLEALYVWRTNPALLIDLSPQSLDFCKGMLSASGMIGRCTLRRGDILSAGDLPAAERIICGELLEHVPDPAALIGGLRSALEKNGRAFLTGAINAPQPDHIFLFRNERELIDLVESEGLSVRAHLTVRHPSRQDDDSPPEVTAMVVEHAA